MRFSLAVGLIASALLAGCSGGSGMNAMVLQPQDLPAACEYAAVDDYDFIRDNYNWTQNPGPVDVILENTDPWNATGAWLAVFDCGDGGEEAFGWATAFNSAAAATAAAVDIAECGEGLGWPVFVAGNVISQFDLDISTEDAEEAWANFDRAANGIKARTGATLMCQEDYDEARAESLGQEA